MRGRSSTSDVNRARASTPETSSLRAKPPSPRPAHPACASYPSAYHSRHFAIPRPARHPPRAAAIPARHNWRKPKPHLEQPSSILRSANLFFGLNEVCKPNLLALAALTRDPSKPPASSLGHDLRQRLGKARQPPRNRLCCGPPARQSQCSPRFLFNNSPPLQPRSETRPSATWPLSRSAQRSRLQLRGPERSEGHVCCKPELACGVPRRVAACDAFREGPISLRRTSRMLAWLTVTSEEGCDWRCTAPTIAVR
jgi:hypothetical protein